MRNKFAAGSSGTRNQGSGSEVVVSRLNVFSSSYAMTPASYYVPGNGNPAISTSDWYYANGMYNFRPYDLDAMGAQGAAVKAAQGGKRYVWITSADHPIGGWCWRGGEHFLAGFSHQPSELPRTMQKIIFLHNSKSDTDHGGAFQTYEFPFLWYNVDDATVSFYLFAEAGPQHYTALWRSSDMLTWTFQGISHYHTVIYGSFLRYVRKNGPGSYSSVAYCPPNLAYGFWSSSNALDWTSSGVAISGSEIDPFDDAAGRTFEMDNVVTAGSITYGIGREYKYNVATPTYGSIYPINPTTFDKLDSPTIAHVTDGFDPMLSGPVNAGPGYLQGMPSYVEDGLLHCFVAHGYPSGVNTASMSGRGGASYANGGGLKEQFIDYHCVRYDNVAARLAAPVGVVVSCASSVVTISWENALPQNTYRVYRGTTSATQATLIGDVTGTSTTDAPGLGRFWYKVTTLDSGTERKSRVVSVYASDASAFVNEHIDRVLEDGGDSATINRAFLKRADALLDSVSIRNLLQLWTHAAFGVDQDRATLRIYDLGTTRLPRSKDFNAATASTTYSATGVNGGPCWTNSTTTARGYWGDARGNLIQKKRQITIIVAYERTQTSSNVTFVGSGPIWGTTSDATDTGTLDGQKVLALRHTSGTPGDIQFVLSDAAGAKTATVAASGSGLQIAIGTYDGTSMKAWTGSTAGTAVTALDPNPDFASNLGIIEGALAGARQNNSSGNSGTSGNDMTVGGFGYKYIYPFLGSGSTHCYTLSADTVADVRVFTEPEAQCKIQSVMILEGAIDATKIASIITFLQSTTDW